MSKKTLVRLEKHNNNWQKSFWRINFAPMFACGHVKFQLFSTANPKIGCANITKKINLKLGSLISSGNLSNVRLD